MHSIETIRQEVHTAVEELLTVAKVHEGQLFVGDVLPVRFVEKICNRFS